MEGLAIGDDPLGPFTKHPLNPVITSGHETTLFPYKTGIAALVTKDGNEHNTIQYSEDGVNFDIASIVEFMPAAGGPFVPDIFTDTKDGRGITWGISHFINVATPDKFHSVLTRFDCDLSQDHHYPEMKKHRVNHKPDVYYRHGLTEKRRQEIIAENEKLRTEKE